MSIDPLQARATAAYREEIRDIVIRRSRFSLLFALALNILYIFLEIDLFRDHQHFYFAIKTATVLLLCCFLPFTYSKAFQRRPLSFAAGMLIAYLFIDSSLFVLSGCHSTYVTSSILTMLFMSLVFPYNHKLALFLMLSIMGFFNLSLLVLVNGKLLNIGITPAQDLDAIFILNQNVLLSVVGLMIFIKSLVEERLRVEEHIARMRTQESQQYLKDSLHALQQTQNQLIQSEKMAGLGRVVAGIAHELNNPINYIYGNLKPLEHYVEYLQLTAGESKPADFRPGQSRKYVFQDLRQLIATLREGATRMRDTIFDLRAFSHRSADTIHDDPANQEADFEIFDLESCLDKSLSLCGHLHRGNVVIEKHYSNPPPAWGNASRYNQIFMNLLTNAFQSLPESGGRITLTTRTECKDKGESVVSICIEDTGVGIHPAHLSRIFEPFFTTKPEGKGTGLGLAITHAVVKGLGGEIQVGSKLYEGSRFTVILPLRNFIWQPEIREQLKGEAA